MKTISALPPWWEEQRPTFRDYRLCPRRSVHHYLILTLRMKKERVLKIAEFLGFFALDSQVCRTKKREPLPCSLKSSFYNLWGALTAGDCGGVEVVSKLSSVGNMVVPLLYVLIAIKRSNWLERWRSWTSGSPKKSISTASEVTFRGCFIALSS